MIAKHITNGRNAVSLFRYLTEERYQGGELPEPRAAWVTTLHSPTSDPAITLRRMQGIVADAPILKQLAGKSTQGQKLRKPYAHLVFSWPAGETPNQNERLEAVESGLAAVGLDRHMTVLVAHEDSNATHVHTVSLRIDPATGIAAKMSRSKLRLSRWCEEEEQNRTGRLVIPARAERRVQRERFAAAVAEEMKLFVPAAVGTARFKAKARADYKRAVTQRLRDTGRFPLTATTRTRGAGRQEHTAAETEEWANHYASETGTDQERRSARARLAAEQLAEREKQLEDDLAAPPAPVVMPADVVDQAIAKKPKPKRKTTTPRRDPGPGR